MDRNDLIIVISLALFCTFTLGWILRWAYGSLNRINASDMGEIDDLANRLHEAEQAKDNAEALLYERDAELHNQLSQAYAERDAAMEGLGNARRETEDLRNQLEDS